MKKYIPVALRTTYKSWEVLHAMSWFLSSYHSGQWSRGYRYLSITLRRLYEQGDHYPISRSLSNKEARLYRYLVRTYKDKV